MFWIPCLWQTPSALRMFYACLTSTRVATRPKHTERTTSARRLGSPSGDLKPRTGGHNKQEVRDAMD